MKITEKQVRDRLQTILDPELHVNIVDLGLIYKINMHRAKGLGQSVNIEIVMTLTTPGCPLSGMFDVLVRQALKKLPGIDVEKDVKIELTFDPPWTMEMMDEGARAELGL